MSQTRSGLTYRGDYDAAGGLTPNHFSSDNELTAPDIERLLRGDFERLAQAPGVDTTAGNIAGLIAKFSGYDLFVQASYSTQSSMSYESVYQFDLASQTTSFPGPMSLQSNGQWRNHTEPKLLQEFSDQFLHDASAVRSALRWLVLVTDRPCCSSCIENSVKPAATWCQANGVSFLVIDLDKTILEPRWSMRRWPDGVFVQR